MVGAVSPGKKDSVTDDEQEWFRGAPPLEPPGPPGGGGDPSPQPAGEPGRPVISNAFLGLAAFLGAEAMFFAGLIGAFLVFRYGSKVWPPPFQPRLPVGVTAGNTVILLFSAFTMARATWVWKNNDRQKLNWYLLATSALGVLFLLIQGSEWIRLIRFGLTISSGVYGGTFYTLIGFHGAHVLGAVIWLLAVMVMLRRAPFTPRYQTRLGLCAVYWYFVVGLWPFLFGFVYLA